MVSPEWIIPSASSREMNLDLYSAFFSSNVIPITPISQSVFFDNLTVNIFYSNFISKTRGQINIFQFFPIYLQFDSLGPVVFSTARPPVSPVSCSSSGRRSGGKPHRIAPPLPGDQTAHRACWAFLTESSRRMVVSSSLGWSATKNT